MIIEVFKIFKGFEDVSYNINFTLSQSELRAKAILMSYSAYKPNSRLDIRKFSFSVRVIFEMHSRTLYCSVTPSVLSSVACSGLVFEKQGYL